MSWKNLLIVTAAIVLLAAAPASAVRIDFVPASSVLAPNDVLSLDVVVSELGAGVAPSLGAFDVAVSFDPTILSFQGASFGTSLGDPGAFEAITGVDTGMPGVVGLAEISLLSPGALDALQGDSFLIGSVDFRALSGGSSSVVFSDALLSDAFANALDVSTGSADVTVVPEPTAALVFLLGSLLVGRRLSGAL